MTTPGGGPAFPQPISLNEHSSSVRDFPMDFGAGGMTLRDYIAIAVLPTLIDILASDRESLESAACEELAYKFANNMLAMREVTP